MKVSDKLSKVNDSFTVYMYDNGFMLEIGGKSADDDWITTKILCPTIDDVVSLVKEAASMDRND